MTEIDYYEAQRMVEEEARERRRGDEELRDLIARRNQETFEELRDEMRSLQRVLDARTADRV